MNDFEKNLIKKMTKIHLGFTNNGNRVKNATIYESRVTPSYINVRCAISKKCRFAVWYKFSKNKEGDPIDITWFRTINCNHDLSHHQLADETY